MADSKNRPAILEGITPGTPVRFGYQFADGTSGEITGTYEGAAGTGWDNLRGVKIRLSARSVSAHAARPEVDKAGRRATGRGIMLCRIPQITPGANGTIAAPAPAPAPASYRSPAATERQVAYALSLCELDCPGSGNYVRYTAGEFAAMSRSQISAWITMARDELGAWA